MSMTPQDPILIELRDLRRALELWKSVLARYPWECGIREQALAKIEMIRERLRERGEDVAEAEMAAPGFDEEPPRLRKRGAQ